MCKSGPLARPYSSGEHMLTRLARKYVKGSMLANGGGQT